MRHILYIINPISGTGGKASLQTLIDTTPTAAGIPYSIHHSVINGDYSFLYPVIEEQGVTDVVIAGGDGTINQVLNSVRGFDIQFGIIPTGSGNGLAFSAGIPKAKDKALDIIFKGKSLPTDAFQINGRFACMLCGLGLDAQVAHDFAKDPRRGLKTYVQKAVADFFTAKAYPFRIAAGGEVLTTDAFFISVANSNQFGNYFTIAPRASLTDGLLDIVVVTAQSKLSMLLQTFRQVGGFNPLQQSPFSNKEGGVIYFQAKELFIENLGAAPLHVDGDPAETEAVLDIKVLPNFYKLIIPAP
jgi:diacylglycerol kinase (ATP)